MLFTEPVSPYLLPHTAILTQPGQAKCLTFPCFDRQVILRGVGHAALHNPGEVNLCTILQSSIVYDQRFLDRTVQSKQAKKSPKRWKKVSASSTPDDAYPPIGCF